MRILFLGGTAFMGPEAVRLLAADGHTIACFHRGRTPLDGVEHILGDRKELPDMRLAEWKPDAVVDMMALTEKDARTALECLPDVPLTLSSSCDVYRFFSVVLGTEDHPVDNTPVDEDGPLREKLYPFHTDYDKILVEKAYRGRGATILRLPMVYGPGDQQHRLHGYLKEMDAGNNITIGETQAAWRTTRGYVTNVATAIVRAMGSGKLYNVGEPLFRTEADWIRMIGEAAGWKGNLIIVPDSEKPAEFNAAQHVVADSSRIRRELNFEDPVPYDEALRRTIDWERANPPK